MMESPRLKDYVNYREFLNEYYKYKRRSSKGLKKYSYSDFSASADIKSPNYLKLIIEGKRNLSEKMIFNFSQALKLDRQETSEFETLVHYNQSTSPDERFQYLKTLKEHRESKKSLGLSDINWLKVIILSLSDQKNVTYEMESLLQLFRGRVKKTDLKRAMKALCEEQAFCEVSPGKYEPTAKRNALPKMSSLEIQKLQTDLMFFGLESLFKDEIHEREFGSFSAALTAEEFEAVKFELRKFRKKLMTDIQMKRESQPGDQIYQIQMQVFPLTEEVKK